MYTPGHVVMNVALLGSVVDPRLAVPVAVGAALPDLPVFVLFARERLRGTPEDTIWAVHYQRRGWLDLIHLAHSIPLAAALLALGLVLGITPLAALGGSMLLHDLGDLPVHAIDAHRHFFPLSEWRFVSPISYWDPSRHGARVALVEMALAFVAIAVLWRWPLTIPTRVLLATVAAYYPFTYWRTFLRRLPRPS